MTITSAFNIVKDTSFTGNSSATSTTQGITTTSFVPQVGKRYILRLVNVSNSGNADIYIRFFQGTNHVANIKREWIEKSDAVHIIEFTSAECAQIDHFRVFAYTTSAVSATVQLYDDGIMSPLFDELFLGLGGVEQVSDNTALNKIVKAIFVPEGQSLSLSVTEIRLRKAFYSSNIKQWVNQVFLGNSTPHYSEGFQTEEEALQHLENIITFKYGNTPLLMFISWDSLNVGQTLFNVSGCHWHAFNTLPQNAFVELEKMRHHSFKVNEDITANFFNSHHNRVLATHSSSSGGITSVSEIRGTGESGILTSCNPVSHFCTGKENVVFNDNTEGLYTIWETTNCIYGDTNMVVKRGYNPYLDIMEHYNEEFLDEPDGTRREFYLPDFLYSANSLQVFKNGLLLTRGIDYEVYPEHDVVIFDDNHKPASGDVLRCHFITKIEHYKQNLSFEGLKLENINGNSLHMKLVGLDTGCLTDNNYSQEKYGFAQMEFNIEGDGTASQYKVEIIDQNDIVSGLPGKALHYEHGTYNGNTSSAACSRTENIIPARLQAGKIICEVDIFIPETVWDEYSNYNGAINWLTFQEFWEGRSYQYVGGLSHDMIERKITVGLLKSGKNDPLHFEVWGDDIRVSDLVSVLSEPDKLYDSDETMLRGEWFTLRTEIHPGNENHGRVVLQIKKQGIPTFVTIYNNPFRTVCRVKADYREDLISGYTDIRNTKRAIYENFSPMKLYTSTAIQKECNPEIYFRNYHLDCIRSIKEGDMLLL